MHALIMKSQHSYMKLYWKIDLGNLIFASDLLKMDYYLSVNRFKQIRGVMPISSHNLQKLVAKRMGFLDDNFLRQQAI